MLDLSADFCPRWEIVKGEVGSISGPILGVNISGGFPEPPDASDTSLWLMGTAIVGVGVSEEGKPSTDEDSYSVMICKGAMGMMCVSNSRVSALVYGGEILGSPADPRGNQGLFFTFSKSDISNVEPITKKGVFSGPKMTGVELSLEGSSWGQAAFLLEGYIDRQVSQRGGQRRRGDASELFERLKV